MSIENDSYVVWKFLSLQRQAHELGLQIRHANMTFIVEDIKYPEISASFELLAHVEGYLRGFSSGLERGKPKTVRGAGMGSTGDGVRGRKGV